MLIIIENLIIQCQRIYNTKLSKANYENYKYFILNYKLNYNLKLNRENKMCLEKS